MMACKPRASTARHAMQWMSTTRNQHLGHQHSRPGASVLSLHPPPTHTQIIAHHASPRTCRPRQLIALMSGTCLASKKYLVRGSAWCRHCPAAFKWEEVRRLLRVVGARWLPQHPCRSNCRQHRLPGMGGAEEGRLAMNNSCTYQRLQCFRLLRVGRGLCEGMSRLLVVRVAWHGVGTLPWQPCSPSSPFCLLPVSLPLSYLFHRPVSLFAMHRLCLDLGRAQRRCGSAWPRPSLLFSTPRCCVPAYPCRRRQ